MNNLKIKIGTNAAGPVVLDLATAPHVLIAGATGSGKSVCIQGMLASLLHQNPHGIDLYIIDPKMIDYIRFKPACKGYACNATEAETLLQTVNSLMMDRYRIMQAGGKCSEKPVIVVWDEIASLLDSKAKKALLPLFNQLLRLGRAARVVCIGGTQSVRADILSGQAKANCPTRICFRVTSALESRIALDRSGAELLKGKGDGILLRSDGSQERFQGSMVSDSAITSAVAGSAISDISADSASPIPAPTFTGSAGSADGGFGSARYEESCRVLELARQLFPKRI